MATRCLASAKPMFEQTMTWTTDSIYGLPMLWIIFLTAAPDTVMLGPDQPLLGAAVLGCPLSIIL